MKSYDNLPEIDLSTYKKGAKKLVLKKPGKEAVVVKKKVMKSGTKKMMKKGC